jgi:tight adherence protein C
MNIRLPDLTNFPLGGTLILLGAFALTLSGIALVLYSARMTREAVSRRVDMIRPGGVVVARVTSLSETLVRSGQKGLHERETREMAKLIVRIGMSAQRAASALVGVRLASVLVLALLGYLGASHWSLLSGSRLVPFLISAGLGMVGWFLPIMVIGRRIKAHTKAVVNGLPDALELLVICVEAGLSFEEGIDRIGGMLRKSQPALSGELALTSADLKILPSRDVALANLAGRVDAPSIRTVVTTLAQTLRYGTPLAQALRLVAGELRTATLLRLQERANKLPALMTIPMMLFIMPTIFIIVAGPAILKVMDAFKHH